MFMCYYQVGSQISDSFYNLPDMEDHTNKPTEVQSCCKAEKHLKVFKSLKFLKMHLKSTKGLILKFIFHWIHAFEKHTFLRVHM